jgi:transposase
LGVLPNDAAGFRQLHEQVNDYQRQTKAQRIHLIVEPTGGYELAIVAFAYGQNWDVSLPRPEGPRKQVRDWAKGEGRRAKTDRQDARLLAQLGADKRPQPQAPLASEVSELDTLLKRRQDLEQLLRQEQNRLGELQSRPGVPPAVVRSLQEVIAALEKALAELEAAITQHLRQYDHLQQQANRLLALPGIGPKNVLPLLVLLYRWHTLTHGQGSAKGLTALVGLDPQPFESGSSVRRTASISHMGNAEVRRLLYMRALGALRGHNPLHDFYDRLVGRGKAKKLALVAASRKLLTWSWAIFSTGTLWNPALLAP